MAIKLIAQSFCDAQGGLVCEYIADSAADIANLPACCTGSVCVVADKGGAVYMVNASGEWKEQ